MLDPHYHMHNVRYTVTDIQCYVEGIRYPIVDMLGGDYIKYLNGDTVEVKTKADRRKFYSSKDWNYTRSDILARDNYECQWCKANGKVTTNKFNDIVSNDDKVILEVDHIIELEEAPELAFEWSNLRTLCKDCHNKRHQRFNYDKNFKPNKWNDERY